MDSARRRLFKGTIISRLVIRSCDESKFFRGRQYCYLKPRDEVLRILKLISPKITYLRRTGKTQVAPVCEQMSCSAVELKWQRLKPFEKFAAMVNAHLGRHRNGWSGSTSKTRSA